MATEALGLLPVFVYVGAVVVSIPASLLTYGIGGWLGSTATALRYVGAGVAGLVLAGGTALALVVDPASGLAFVALSAGAALVLAAFPLFIGRQLLARWTPLSPDDALEYAVLGWPVGLVASFAVFLAPGGPAQGNATFATGPWAAVVWIVLGLVVTFGPAVAGMGMHRLVDWAGGAEKTY